MHVVRDLRGIFLDFARRLDAARVSLAAASMAYYALFSLFPFLVILVVAASYVLEEGDAFQAVVDAVGQALPGSRALIADNVRQVIRLRGPVGLLGTVTLIWSASSFFFLLADNIERAWPGGSFRSSLHRRLLALAIVIGLAILTSLSLLATAALQALPQAEIVGSFEPFGLPLWSGVSRLTSWALAFLMFLSLYRWMPRRRVPWRAAFAGAMAATLLWLLAGQGFVWYLDSGLVHYELVYGSIGTVIVLMLWTYVSSWLTLAGAHLSAAIGQRGGGHAEAAGRQEVARG